MRKFSLFLWVVLAGVSLLAQSPAGFQYQAIVRDDQGQPVADESITVVFSLIQGSNTGNSVYSESHSITTNPYGLINLTIGEGSALSGDFNAIDWSPGVFFIKTEIDLGNGLQDFGTKQLLSVPYALYGEDEDADATNEIQALSLEGSVLSISEGNSVDLGVLGADTDDQTLIFTGTELSISEGNTVDLSVLQDGTGTDAQELTLTGSELSISGGNTVDLGDLGADTDDQTLSLQGSNLTIADGNTVDLSVFLDDTDTQLTEEEVDAYVANNGYLTTETDDQALSLADNTLTLEDGGSVDLSGYLDNTDTQLTEEEVDAYVANNGYLTAESDDQALSLTDNTLSLEDGGEVDLSAYLDNTDTQLTEEEVDAYVANNGYLTAETDDQALSLTDNTLSLEDGGEVDLSTYLDNTDNQQLTLDGTTLTLENGGSVDLSPYAGQNTDSQTLSLTGDELSLQNGGTVDLSPYLDNTDTQNLSDVLGQGADANGNVISNLADPTSPQEAATKNYVDANDLGAFLESSDVISAGDANDDFVFGSLQLADDNATTDDNARMFFDKSKGAFRAGQVSGDLWDDAKVGDNSVVLGNNSQASEYGSVAIGYDNYAKASGAIVIGTSSEATTDYAIAIGQYNSATGLNSTALGFETTAIGSNSTTMGNNTIAKSDNEVAIGAFNTNYTPAGDNTDRAFVIGNGDYSATSDAFTVYKNGNALLDGNLSLNDPSADAHATTKAYVDAEIAAINTFNQSGDFELATKQSLLVDVENTIGAANSSSSGKYGQSFIPNTTGQITQITATIADPIPPGTFSPNVGETVEVSIYEGAGLDGTVLVTETFTIPVVEVNVPTPSSFAFTNPVEVMAGSTYTFSMYMTDGSGSIQVKFDSSNPYADGQAYTDGFILPSSDYDLVFSVEIDPSEVVSLAVSDGGNVGVGTNAPDASAILDITSSSQGLLIPRMTAAQRDNISSPATGLLVYNTDDNEINKYNGAAWVGEAVNTDEQSLDNVLGQGADAGAVAITNLADPTNDQDAATKSYVDEAINGLTTDGSFDFTDPNLVVDIDQNVDVTSLGSADGIGQSFQPTQSGTLGRITTNITGGATNVNEGTFFLYEGDGLDGTILAQFDFVPLKGGALNTFDISGVEVTAGQYYTFFLDFKDLEGLSVRVGNDEITGSSYRTRATGSETSYPNYDLIFTSYISSPISILAQGDNQNVGIGTSSPAAGAALEVSSTSGGLLLPRMTTAQRDAITSPAYGLMVFNTESLTFQGYTAVEVLETLESTTGSTDFSGFNSINLSSTPITFTPSSSGAISEIDIYLKNTSVVAGTLTIKTGVACGDTPSLLGTSSSLSTSGAGWYNVTFATPVDVTSGTTYYIGSDASFTANSSSTNSLSEIGAYDAAFCSPDASDFAIEITTQTEGTNLVLQGTWVDLH